VTPYLTLIRRRRAPKVTIGRGVQIEGTKKGEKGNQIKTVDSLLKNVRINRSEQAAELKGRENRRRRGTVPKKRSIETPPPLKEEKVTTAEGGEQDKE